MVSTLAQSDRSLTHGDSRRQQRFDICSFKCGSLHPGDTIEVHYVHFTANVSPGPTLGACLNDATENYQG
ncbi:delta-class carbonic anhydrase [Marinobacter adhaerens]|uniref:delta-class carbonic anhydrase n=1 Tax=Marinobacter adhaerens TaxID=1033846 RepID=UPI00356B686A